MVTKWRSKSVSLLLLACAIVIWTLSAFCAADLYKHRNFGGNYFQSPTFNAEIDYLTAMIAVHHVEGKDYDKKTPEEQLGRELYENLRDNYENNPVAFDREVGRQIKIQKRFLDGAKKYLDQRSGSIQYVFKNKKNGDVYSNLNSVPAKWPEVDGKILSRVDIPFSNVRYGDYSPFTPFMLADDDLEGTVIVLKDGAKTNVIQNQYEAFRGVQDRMIVDAIELAILLAAGVALSVYLRRYRSEYVAFAGFRAYVSRAWPLDIRFALAVGALLIFIGFLFQGPDGMAGSKPPLHEIHIPMLIVSSLLAGYAFFNARGALALLRNPERLSAQLNDSLIMQLKSVLERRSLIFKFIAFAGIAMIFGLLPAVMSVNGRNDGGATAFVFFYFIGFILIVVPYVLRKLLYLKKIVQGAEAHAAGDFAALLPVKGKGQLTRLATSINNMKQGLEKSVEKQLVSDRLKTELITNVSHDLKTPLTSIINYVDLLKRDDATPEQTSQYVEVLDRQTQRLKALIDDLFEASKMASGATELQLELVDVAALLNQALGEFGEKIEASGLTFRVSLDKSHVYAMLDGKKTWRVFENLISNALKYSLQGTRVYVNVSEKDDRVILTMQNISAYEIAFAAEELFERFKRGDPSRHTEGSGLGLAIAKSIVELQGGTFDIEIDGDQFKAIIVWKAIKT